jgi:hypothetical protein
MLPYNVNTIKRLLSKVTRTVTEEKVSSIFLKRILPPHPYLICPAGLGQVSDPFNTVIAAFFKHFQKPYNQSRGCEHEDLEIDVYGRPGPHLSGCRAGELGSRI